jgi:hypothetical protein
MSLFDDNTRSGCVAAYSITPLLRRSRANVVSRAKLQLLKFVLSVHYYDIYTLFMKPRLILSFILACAVATTTAVFLYMFSDQEKVRDTNKDTKNSIVLSTMIIFTNYCILILSATCMFFAIRSHFLMTAKCFDFVVLFTCVVSTLGIMFGSATVIINSCRNDCLEIITPLYLEAIISCFIWVAAIIIAICYCLYKKCSKKNIEQKFEITRV